MSRGVLTDRVVQAVDWVRADSATGDGLAVRRRLVWQVSIVWGI
jgi:hypothetical protein